MDGLMFLQQWWQDLNQTTLFSSILFTVILFHLVLKLTRSSRLNLPPSPPKLPIIGNLHQLGANLHRSLRTLSGKYGPVVLLHVGNNPLLIVSSAEIAGEILKSHDDFLYRPQTRAAKALFCGCCDIAFCPFGDYWRRVRKICVQELLSHRRVQAFHFLREEEVSNMVEKIRLSSLNGATVNLTEEFATISSTIIMKSAFGRVQQEEGKKRFIELSRSAMNLLGYFCFEDMFPYLGWVDNLTGLAPKLKTTSRELHTLIDRMIEERKNLMKNEDRSDKKDFLDILLDRQKDGSHQMELTRENIISLLVDMFVGGTETTSTTMEWAMAELVKNPSIMRKAQEEVRRVVGENSKIEESDINKMEYLKWIVKESLRLHAPLMISRATVASTKLAGYDIPPETIVLINAWAIQRDGKLWDRPEEFIPERFGNISVDFIDQNNNFIPFGAGRRSCPGISLATAEAGYVLANLLYWFDWELPDGARGEELDMNDAYVLLIRRKTPLCLVPVMGKHLINYSESDTIS